MRQGKLDIGKTMQERVGMCVAHLELGFRKC